MRPIQPTGQMGRIRPNNTVVCRQRVENTLNGEVAERSSTSENQMNSIRQRLFFSLIFLATPILGASSLAMGQDRTGEPLKVLFIGNSYTNANDLPLMVAAMANSGGKKRIDVQRHLYGGSTLERHVKETGALERIQKRKWDMVVLQEQSLLPVINRDSMFEHAATLHGEIAKQDAQTIWYLTWARLDIPEMQKGADPNKSPDYARRMFQMSGNANSRSFENWCQQQKVGLEGGLNDAYYTLAKDLGGEVAPVGIAWKKAFEADPSLRLHLADMSHPTRTGTYLAACVFYATLLDESPVGLPRRLEQDRKILALLPEDQARLLQEIAWETVEETKQIDAKVDRDR